MKDSSLLVERTVSSFVPSTCMNVTSFGANCNTSSTACDVLQPCQNDGVCNNTNVTPIGFDCLCSAGFRGTRCEHDQRPCRADTCRNQGEHFSILYTDRFCGFSDRNLPRTIEYHRQLLVSVRMGRSGLRNTSEPLCRCHMSQQRCVPIITLELYLPVSGRELFWSPL